LQASDQPSVWLPLAEAEQAPRRSVLGAGPPARNAVPLSPLPLRGRRGRGRPLDRYGPYLWWMQRRGPVPRGGPSERATRAAGPVCSPFREGA
jgi:hypothetical protein